MKEVTNGFRGFREINTVVYEPGAVTVEEMESALKNAGTYYGTAEQ